MSNDFFNYLGGAGLNLLVALIIVRFIYSEAHGKGYILLFLMFNTVIYFVMIMLNSIALSLGVGFGLFAVFSVLRYRTEEMPIREITYLFVMIALPLINSALPSGENFAKIALANVAIIAVLYAIEKEWGFHFEASKVLTYEVIDLIKPQNRGLLLEDLRSRTGLPVTRVEVGDIDFLRDTAQLRIYYDLPRNGSTVSPEVVRDQVTVQRRSPTMGIFARNFNSEAIADQASVQQVERPRDIASSEISGNGGAVQSFEPTTGILTRTVSPEAGGGEPAVEPFAPGGTAGPEVNGEEIPVQPIVPTRVILTQIPSSEAGSDEVAAKRALRTVGIIALAAIGCVVGGLGGFFVGLSGFLTHGH